jgi:predicted phage-related endonuclease
VNAIALSSDQRSDAWRQARIGRVTGSRASDMLAKVKSGEAAGRRNLRVQLVLERLTGVPQEDGFQSKDMARGTEMEAEAFAAYEALTGNLTRRAGFLGHPELMAGCSVDGEIGNFAGIVELKVPKSATHLGYLRSRQVPDDYLKQVQHCLWITGAAWCDFVSYDPRFPDGLQLLITRVTMPDDERAAYELLVRQFLREVDDEFAEVARMAMRAA